MLRRARILCC